MSRLVFQYDLELPEDIIDLSGVLCSSLSSDVIVPEAIYDKLRTMGSRPGAHVTFIVSVFGEQYKVIDIRSGPSYSLALDIGTTNIAGVLVDNFSGGRSDIVSIENPQLKYGSDILSRLQLSIYGDHKAIRDALINGVNELIVKACKEQNISERYIHSVVAAGNTAMSHYFLDHDVSSIPVAPYEPAVREPGFLHASAVDINVHPEAILYVFPNAGSYVGGDIISGVVSSGQFRSEDLSVLIDVGTNAEIVIGNSEWLLVSAGAAGPALEEGISAIGKRAESGVLYDIVIEGDSAECKTFDGSSPKGVCGSGMVSLIYEMHKCGVIGNDGMLKKGDREDNKEDEVRKYVIPCSNGGELSISQTEIENFLRSKAAMFTLLMVLLRSVGLTFSDVKRLYVAGALGNGIDIKKASGIGMLPRWPASMVSSAGNASLEGAIRLIDDSTVLNEISSIMRTITYKNMHDDPEFMKEFRGGLFIPHTNPSLLDV
ncbi:MAG: DUF4445 domain-containing protein [Nitrospirota bacterium]|nr:MAG: DUF4445 domain-containing protein [Nitrospirota bacterium]